MLPFFEIFWIQIFTFWVSITLCFFMFIFMMKKLSTRLSFDFIIFKKNILWYFISIFFFSRLFYVIAQWSDLKYIDSPIQFFIMNEYNFSLVGAIVGFFLVLFLTMKIRKEKLDNFIDGIAISFFFALIVWYIGAFLGWEVYGKETQIGIEILYTHPYSPVPYQVPVFPLPIIYALLSFILFSSAYILSMYIHIKSLIGYLGFILFSCLLLVFEFFSGKSDIFSNLIGINMVQIFSIVLIISSGYKLYWVYQENGNKKQIIIGK